MYFVSKELAPPVDRPLRRGFTLVEMLVVVALLIMMMTILASIFQKATGAISVSRTYQELDNNLKFLDQTIRNDLANITAKMTPPNDPANKTGYFEYGENAPADAQGEDTDDYLAFTVKAPEGQPFVGRTWQHVALPTTPPPYTTQVYPAQGVQPITITSEFAEVIYFLRNGNLYRRVLLIVPERQSAPFPATAANGLFPPIGSGVSGPFGGLTTSWMSVNDISARPSLAPFNPVTGAPSGPRYNTLGDLTNRENRFARQRFCNDYWNAVGGNFTSGPDGVVDDGNFDGIPDYWPTLTASQVYIARHNSNNVQTNGFLGLMNEDPTTTPQFVTSGGVTTGYPRIDDPSSGSGQTSPTRDNLDVYAFPFVFPNMYSVPEAHSTGTNAVSGPIGWLHALDPSSVGGFTSTGYGINHAPLEFGDSLPFNPSTQSQTWWGFPTFRETASANWRDPIEGPGNLGHNYFGVIGAAVNTDNSDRLIGTQIRHLRTIPQSGPLVPVNFLPTLGSVPPLGTPASPAVPFGSDGFGNSGADFHALISFNPGATGNTISNALPNQLSGVWDDDLIMTGVRSFDVKAYDPNATSYNDTSLQIPPFGQVSYNAGYFDLGYAATDYAKIKSNTGLIVGTPQSLWDPNTGQPAGMGHEGRMPPLTSDNRVDPQRPQIKFPVTNNGVTTIQLVPNNVGDNTGASVSPLPPLTGKSSSVGGVGSNLAPQRLRRVWDSWSTDYTRAPAVDINYRGAAWRDFPFDQPIYPSYPPPYPEPLRGIQIQIRVSDVKNERVKILTIRQDFSDKL